MHIWKQQDKQVNPTSRASNEQLPMRDASHEVLPTRCLVGSFTRGASHELVGSYLLVGRVELPMGSVFVYC